MDARQKNDNPMMTNTMRNVYMVMENLNVANQSILDSCHSSVLRLDNTGNITYISKELCTLAGLDMQQAVGQAATVLSPILAQLLQTTGNIEIKATDGTRYHFSRTQLNDLLESGEIYIFTNISTVVDLYGENQRLKEEARQLQLIDQDTSLLTKRALLLVLEAQVSRCRRYETPLSVIMLDLNNTGDSSDLKLKLLKISRLLKDQLRWSDMISRSADNQFTIILPETERPAAISLINKIRDTISQWDDKPSVHFGLSEWQKEVNSSDLLARCERDLQDSMDSTDTTLIHQA